MKLYMYFRLNGPKTEQYKMNEEEQKYVNQYTIVTSAPILHVSCWNYDHRANYNCVFA